MQLEHCFNEVLRHKHAVKCHIQPLQMHLFNRKPLQMVEITACWPMKTDCGLTYLRLKNRSSTLHHVPKNIVRKIRVSIKKLNCKGMITYKHPIKANAIAIKRLQCGDAWHHFDQQLNVHPAHYSQKEKILTLETHHPENWARIKKVHQL